MKTVSIEVDMARPDLLPKGRVNPAVLDNTTEDDLLRQHQEDEIAAMQEMGAFVRGLRDQLGLTQRDFAERLNVSLDTIRNWEQGRRYPTGAAKSLLKVLHKMPEACMAALS